MKNIAIIIDSTTIKTDKLKNAVNVYQIPLQVIIEGQAYEDNLKTNEDIKPLLDGGAQVTTSQPVIEHVTEVFELIRSKNYDHIFALPLSSHLSGTINTLQLAQSSAYISNLEIIDTLTVASGITVIAETLLDMAEEDRPLDEMRKKINDIADNNFVYIYPASLKRLSLSGRMSKTVGCIANMLKLKILLKLDNKGEKVDKEHVFRSEDALMTYVLDKLKEKRVDADNWTIYLLECEAPEQVKKLKEALISRYPGLDLRHGELPTTIAVHTGLCTVGIQCTKKY